MTLTDTARVTREKRTGQSETLDIIVSRTKFIQDGDSTMYKTELRFKDGLILRYDSPLHAAFINYPSLEVSTLIRKEHNYADTCVFSDTGKDRDLPALLPYYESSTAGQALKAHAATVSKLMSRYLDQAQ